MSTIKIGTVGEFFRPRFENFTWVKDPDTGWRKCYDMPGEFLYGKTPLELVNIISLHPEPITRIEIANTPSKKGMFLFDKKSRIVAHVVDAQVASDDINMVSRVQTTLKFVDVTDTTIADVNVGITEQGYTAAIISREPQVGFDDDVLTHDRSVRPYWAFWSPN